MLEGEDVLRFMVGISERKRPLGRLSHRSEDNTKMEILGSCDRAS